MNTFDLCTSIKIDLLIPLDDLKEFMRDDICSLCYSSFLSLEVITSLYTSYMKSTLRSFYTLNTAFYK